MRNALSIAAWVITTVGFWLILLSAMCMIIIGLYIEVLVMLLLYVGWVLCICMFDMNSTLYILWSKILAGKYMLIDRDVGQYKMYIIKPEGYAFRVKLGGVDKGISLIDSNGCLIDGFYDSRYTTFTVMYYIVVLSTLATDRHREALADLSRYKEDIIQ